MNQAGKKSAVVTGLFHLFGRSVVWLREKKEGGTHTTDDAAPFKGEKHPAELVVDSVGWWGSEVTSSRGPAFRTQQHLMNHSKQSTRLLCMVPL